jgi:hypothetical protein
VRLENIHSESTSYVSFLDQAQRKKSRNTDRDSIHSVSSIRSVISGMSSLWSSLGLSSSSSAKAEKHKAAFQEQLKYLYSAFTKIPCLRLAPDNKARLIVGYEEFPFDSAVPLFVFKNLSALEIYDVDFRQFHGWDRMADQLRSLTVKRAGVEDPADLLTHIVLDDMDRRRRRSAKAPTSPAQPWPTPTPSQRQSDAAGSASAPSSPLPTASHGSGTSPRSVPMTRHPSGESSSTARPRNRSVSPMRPKSSKHSSSNNYGRSSTPNIRRSSGSSGSSIRSSTPRNSTSNLLLLGGLPSTKWRFLRHLSLADNALTTILPTSLLPLANTLQSLDLSSNLFTEIPDSLSTLTCLRALNLSQCMIESLHSLSRSPLPAITTINLRGNRLTSLAGVEKLLSLERLDVRENKLTDPTELARLTGIPNMQEVYVHRNPFVKTHSDYRVKIFNLFRSTPGYTADIVIDSSGPGYSERKSLVDRAIEPAGVPVVKPPPEDEIAVIPSEPEPAIREESEQPQPLESQLQVQSHRRSYSEYGHSSRRRRKAPRRRIVELSQNGGLQRSHSEMATVPQTDGRSNMSPTEDLGAGGSLSADPNQVRSDIAQESPSQPPSQPPPQLSLTTTFEPPASTPSVEAPSKPPPEFDISSDMYRKKIEALRHDFGNNWLSALGEEAWDNRQRADSYTSADYHPPIVLRPTAGTVRTSSQGIISNGRTLG